MTAPRIPLVRLDSGWLFIVAGLAICTIGALASADRELQTLRVQKSLLDAEETYAYARLRAHEDFLMQLDEPDEALTRRLAAAELNLMPADESPVLRLITYELPTLEWIDRTVERPAPEPVLANNSKLAQLVTGEYRLWIFGAGIMCVFMGLLLDPGVASVRRRRDDIVKDADQDSIDETPEALGAVAVLEAELEEDEAGQAIESTAALLTEEVDEVEDELVEDAVDEMLFDTEEECDNEDELIDAVEDVDEVEDEVSAADELADDEEAEEEEWEEDDEYVREDDSAVDEDDNADEEAYEEEAFELIADDAELEEAEAEDDTSAASETDDDVFAIDEEVMDEEDDEGEAVGHVERAREVISIRPSMSVAPPTEDETAELTADESPARTAKSATSQLRDS